MPLVSFDYAFSQRFPFPAADVYAWATDYRTDDFEKVGLKVARRIRRLNENTLVLTERYGSGVVKRKLVRLYPEQLFYTNTHVSGPYKFSQFLYRIVPEGERASRLEFTGHQVETVASVPSRREIAQRAKKERTADAALWKALARMLAAERREAARKGGRARR